MTIDVDRALGARVDCGGGEWSADDIILYHLAIGAGVPPTDPNDLRYTYERHLTVMPTYGVTLVSGLMAQAMRMPGLDFNVAMLLHGEHDLEVMRPLPVEAQVTTISRIAEIYDKGSAAVVVLEFETRTASEPLMVNRFALFLRGEGGFGGAPGPAQTTHRPQRPPDLVVENRTLPPQALLYRLCGDKHPLHADPRYAAKGGFDRPILHGLCTYGMACKAVVDDVLGGDPTPVTRYRARFAGVVYPGETVTTSMWDERSEVIVEVAVKERPERPVLTNGIVTVGRPG